MLTITSAAVFIKALGLSPGKIIGGELSKAAVSYFKKTVFTDATYSNRLAGIIDGLLDEYRTQFQPDPLGRHIYFWQLQWFWETALTYRLYSNSPLILVEQFPPLDNLLPFTQSELDVLCQRLEALMEADEKLRTLYEEENYKTEIFRFAKYGTEQFAHIISQLDALQAAAPASDSVHLFLDIIEHNVLERFNPKSALGLLEQIEQIIISRYARESELAARVHYLIGLGWLELQESAPANLRFLQAQALHPNNSHYLEQAALVRAEGKEWPEAMELVQQLLVLTPFSSTGWAISLVQKSETWDTKIQTVPAAVRNDSTFKQALLALLIGAERTEEAYEIFREDIATYTAPTAFVPRTRRLHAYLAMIVLENELLALPRRLLAEEMPVTDRPQLRAAYQTLVLLVEAQRGSERFPLILHLVFLRGLAHYLLTGDMTEFKDYRQHYAAVPLELKRRHAYLWVCRLWQNNEPTQMLEVMEQTGTESHHDLEYLRYCAYSSLGRREDAHQSLRHHLQSLPHVNAAVFIRFLFYLNSHCATADERAEFWTSHVAAKHFSSKLPRLLLLASVFNADESRRAEVERWLCEASALLGAEIPTEDIDDTVVYRLELAQRYYSFKSYLHALTALQGWKNFPEPWRQAAWHLALSCRYHSVTDSAELLDEFRQWRLQYPPVAAFCHWEIDLAELLPDWPRIAEIAATAIASFPRDSRMRWYLLLSHHRLHKKEELAQALSALLADPNSLSRFHLFSAAELALRAGFSRLGFQLLYPLALNPNDLAARQKFFTLMARDAELAPLPMPERATPGTVVYYTSNGHPQDPLTLSPEALAEPGNPVAHQLLGKVAGETFEMPQPLMARQLRLVVTQVLDPYSALIRDIGEQSRRQQASMGIQSINFDSSSLESFESTFLEYFGEEQSARHRQTEHLLNEYEAGRLSFSAIAGGLCQGNGLDAYKVLTGPSGRGLVVAPLALFDGIAVRAETNYLLDWTSLPLLHALWKTHDLSPPASLWVSVQLVEFLEELRNDKRRSTAPKMSIGVVEGRLQPHFYPNDFKDRELDYIEELLVWIGRFCRIRLAPEKLDVIRQGRLAETGQIDDLDRAAYFDFFIDTLFLADHADTILLSDDAMAYPHLLTNQSVVSTEKYLRKLFPDRYMKELLPTLLHKAYVGLAVSPEWVLQQFIKDGYQFTGLALRALDSLPISVRYNNQGLIELFALVCSLYLLPQLLLNQKSRLAVQVLSKGLMYFPTAELYNDLMVLLTLQFLPWPELISYVQRDLREALVLVHRAQTQRTQLAPADAEEL